MKYAVPIVGFILAFAMATIAILAIGWIISVLYLLWSGKSDLIVVPRIYWLIIWSVAVSVAVVAGIHSFRATLKRYQDKRV